MIIERPAAAATIQATKPHTRQRKDIVAPLQHHREGLLLLRPKSIKMNRDGELKDVIESLFPDSEETMATGLCKEAWRTFREVSKTCNKEW